MTLRSQIIGCGSYLPEKILTNEDLAAMVDTSDRWIVERTGIRQRHIAADGELTSDLAFHSAENALRDAGMAAQDLDMIVLATTTPDNTFPATATKVQAMLGLTRGAAFDVQAVCSGFLYGLSVGDNFIKTGQVETVLVIGAETFSRIIDWKDRSTCVIFGDGAGSVVLKGSSSADGRGILSTHLHSDGRLNDLLYVDGGPSSSKSVGHVRMSGREVYRHAVLNMSAIVKEAVEGDQLLLYTPIVAKHDFDVAISYLFRRIEENSAEGNFMRVLFSLAPGTDQFDLEVENFRAADLVIYDGFHGMPFLPFTGNFASVAELNSGGSRTGPALHLFL